MKNTLVTFITLAFVLFVSAQAKAQVDYNQLDTYIEQAVQDWGIPGLSVGIVKDGEIVYEKGFGAMEVGSNQSPDEHTLYAIASNTKAFTAVIIAQLVEEGKLNWKDKVQDHLPYFEVYDPFISTLVTVEDLLSHNIGYGTFSGDAIWYKSELAGEALVRKFRNVPQAYEFRDGYGYSNLMFITAGVLIEEVTGKSFKENVTERILNPVGMDRSVVSVHDFGNRGNIATPHAIAGDRNYAIPWVSWDNVQSTGGIISSVHDMSKWMILNMNHGVVGTDTLFSQRNRNYMWNVQNPLAVNHVNRNGYGMQYSGYGLGWFLGDYHGHFRVRHGGGYDGMISTVQMLPDDGLGIVVLTNGVKAPTNAIAYYIMDRFLDRPFQDWSTEMLANYNRWKSSDTRIADRQATRVSGTRPQLNGEDIIGTYHTPLYGNFYVKEVEGKLKIEFEHTPEFSSALEHFHYDTYEIKWDTPQAWFSFGTIQFESDNYGNVTGLSFDVPNDDIFFEELNATRVSD